MHRGVQLYHFSYLFSIRLSGCVNSLNILLNSIVRVIGFTENKYLFNNYVIYLYLSSLIEEPSVSVYNTVLSLP